MPRNNPRLLHTASGTVFVLGLIAVISGCNLRSNSLNENGVRAFQNGNVSMAINEFQKAMIENPASADAYYNLGASYFALGRQNQNEQWLEQAEQLYRNAIQLDDQHIDAHRGLAALLVETEREEFAFDLLQTWQARHPESTAPLIELARLHQEYGDNRRATDLLADALKLDGNDPRALKAMGHIREVQGEYQLALENYNRALQIDPRLTDTADRISALQSRIAQNVPTAGSIDRYGMNPANTAR
ncbi:MAG: tetratricopeptide repeat protein [Planctomycetota bacterium]